MNQPRDISDQVYQDVSVTLPGYVWQAMLEELNERSTKAAILTYQWVGGKR